MPKFDEELKQKVKMVIRATPKKPMHYAFALVGASNGELLLSKTKVSATDKAEAKKSSGAAQMVAGYCFMGIAGRELDRMVFTTRKKVDPKLAKVIRKVVKLKTGLIVDPRIRNPKSAPLESGDGNGKGGDGKVTIGTSRKPRTKPTSKGKEKVKEPEFWSYDHGTKVIGQALKGGRHAPRMVQRAMLQIRKQIKQAEKLNEKKDIDLDDTLLELKGLYQYASSAMLQVTQRRGLALKERKAQVSVRKIEESRKRNAKVRTATKRRQQQKSQRLQQVESDTKSVTGSTARIKAPFNDAYITKIETEGEVGDSTLKAVTDAMRDVQSAQKALIKGGGSLGAFIQAFNRFENGARDYLAEHKKPRSKTGKKRVELCEEMYREAKQIREMMDKNNETARRLAFEIERDAKDDKANGQMVNALEKLLDYPYLAADVRRHAELAVQDSRQALLRLATANFKKLDNPTHEDRASLLVEYCGTKVPSDGTSDVFFISGGDGKPAYVFKSVQGEPRPNGFIPEGSGVVREVMGSRINDVVQRMLGIDLGVPLTTAVELEDDSFKNGRNAKDTKRVGSLQEAIRFRDGDPHEARDLLETSGPELVKAWQRIDPQSIETAALFDFITLNNDRHSENMLLERKPGVKGEKGSFVLRPIDSARGLPTPQMFKLGCASMMPSAPFNPTNPSFSAIGGSFVNQSPEGLKKFSKETQEKLAKLDTREFVEAIKSQYADVSRMSDMQDKVADECFDMVRLSMEFLKRAASKLTKYEISVVYACGFHDVVDAKTEKAMIAAIDEAINLAKLATKLVKQDGTSSLGESVGQRFPFAPELTLKQQIEIVQKNMDKPAAEQFHYQQLQTELADYKSFTPDSKPKLTDELTKPYDKGNYRFLKALRDWKIYGGDAGFKEMLKGDDACYQLEIKKSINELAGDWGSLKKARRLLELGGFAAMDRMMPASTRNPLRGKPLGDQVDAFDEFLR